jgi:hypothetical protein
VMPPALRCEAKATLDVTSPRKAALNSAAWSGVTRGINLVFEAPARGAFAITAIAVVMVYPS